MSRLTQTLAETLPEDADTATLVGRAWLPGARGGPARGRVAQWSAARHHGARADDGGAGRAGGPRGAGPRRGWPGARPAGAVAGQHLRTRPRHRAPPLAGAMRPAGGQGGRRHVRRQHAGASDRGTGARRRHSRTRHPPVDDCNRRRGPGAIRPGSPQAEELKRVLVDQQLWSQYLEVGIGPDAEVFTKAAPLASVGTGVCVGLHPGSNWNNPEPEVVLAVTPRARSSAQRWATM